MERQTMKQLRWTLEEAEALLYGKVQGNRRATPELVRVREALALLAELERELQAPAGTGAR